MYIILIIYDNVYNVDVFEAINESMRIIYESRDGKKMEQDSQTYSNIHDMFLVYILFLRM